MEASPVSGRGTPGRDGTAARRRRLFPSFTVSAFLHLLLLAAAILLARQRIETPPEWVPAAPMHMVFQGGAPKHPSVAAPKPSPKHAVPESAPSAPRAPTSAAHPIPKAAQPAPPPPVESLPLPPPPAPQAAGPAPPLQPAPPASPARPAFPAPMTFSLGSPALPPARPAPERLGRGIDLSLGHGVLGAPDTAIFGRADSTKVGPDWYNAFEAWWERHGYYPPQAGENGDQGDVTLDLVIRRDGRVQSVHLVAGSGSQWLDMAALAVFRDAQLPPLWSDNAATVPLHLTIHYVIVRH